LACVREKEFQRHFPVPVNPWVYYFQIPESPISRKPSSIKVFQENKPPGMEYAPIGLKAWLNRLSINVQRRKT
jgi:hypothetical protein